MHRYSYLAVLVIGTVKHYFFRRILISRFPYVENLLHFNLANFPVNFIEQFVSCFFLSKFLSYHCLHYILLRILHIISRKCRCSMQINLWWQAIPKICMYLILWFRSTHENCKNLILAKYTCFTVLHGMLTQSADNQICDQETQGFNSWLGLLCSNLWQVIRINVLNITRQHNLTLA